MSSPEVDLGDLVISKDLGYGLDTVIIEHRGELRQVVMNSRNGRPAAETLQRISRKLARVSSSIAAGRTKSTGRGQRIRSPTPKGANIKEYVMVLDTTPTLQDGNKSSITELLDLIDQAACEIQCNTAKLADRYHNQPDFAAAGSNSSLSQGKLHDVFVNNTPTHKVAGRQDIDLHMSNVHNRLAASGLEYTDKPAENGEHDSTVSSGQQVQPTPSPLPSVSPTGNDTDTSLAESPDADIVSSRPQNRPASQIPPPDHTTLHQATELSDLSPEKPTVAPSTPPVQEHKHRGLFSHLFHPFHHPASAPRSQIPLQPNVQMLTGTPRPTPGITTTLMPQPSPSPDLPSSPPIIPPIASNPSPYHHAPAAPLDLNVAKWPDQRVREQQQVIRAAMRMGRNKAVQEAAAVERDARRQRQGLMSPGGRKKVGL